MKPGTKSPEFSVNTSLVSELLILPDGRILVHNLTQPFAELLHDLNPNDGQISPRVTRHTSPPYELPN
jgi:hypothetical protein